MITMGFWTGLLIGLAVGAVTGIVIMCIISVSDSSERDGV